MFSLYDYAVFVMSGYVPGVCNIGKTEIRKRYAIAVAGFAIAAFASFIVIFYHMPRWMLLLNFIPLMVGFEGFYQGYLKFCAGFAAAGVYDFTGSGGSRNKVTNPDSRSKDLGKAMQIHVYSFVSMTIVTAIIYFVL